MKFFIMAIVALTSVGCASSNTDVISAPSHGQAAVSKIAVVNNSLLAESIGLNLMKMGFFVVPASNGTNETSLSSPDRRDMMSEAGIDGLLVVKSTDDDDGRPRSANALIYSVDTGQLITGVTWENGHGFGIRGSVTNQMLRDGQHEAAKEIAKELAQVIPR